MTWDERLVSERLPHSSTYHPEWVVASASGGANALWESSPFLVETLHGA